MGNSKVYLLSNIFVGIIPFMLLPILTHYLTPVEYGFLAMFQLAYLAFNSVIGFGSHSSSCRFYFDLKSDTDRANFNGAVFYIYIVSIFIIVFLFLFLKEYISSLLSISVQLLSIALLCSVFHFLLQFRLVQFQIREQALKYLLYQVSYAVLGFILTLYFLYYESFPFWGRIIAITVALICLGIISLYSMINNRLIIFSGINLADFKKCLNFGLPLVPHAVSGVLLSTIERPIIVDVIGMHAAGMYIVALQLSTSIYVVSDALNKAYVPILYKTLTNQVPSELKALRRYSAYFIIFLILCLPLGISIGEYIFIWVVGKEYSSVGHVFILLCIGQVLTTLYMLFSPYLSFHKKTKSLTSLTVSSAALHVALLFYFLPQYGLVGAGYSFICTKVYLLLSTMILVFLTVEKRVVV